MPAHGIFRFINPADVSEVNARWKIEAKLVGRKTYPPELWLWADESGQGYVTKLKFGKAWGWKLREPNSAAEGFLKNNRPVKPINGENS